MYIFETNAKKTIIFMVYVTVQEKGDGLSFTSLKCFKEKRDAMKN